MRRKTTPNPPPHPPSRPARHRRYATAAAATAVAASLLLQGCASTDDTTAGAGHIKLTFLNQSRGQQTALEHLARQYWRETGVAVAIDSPGPADFLPKLQVKSQSGTMPDIYSSFNASSMAPYYKAGWAMNLAPELKGKWGRNFSPGVIKMSTFAKGNGLGVPPGIYTVHWETQAYGLLVDPKATGTDAQAPPRTTGEFVDALTASAKRAQDNKGNKGGKGALGGQGKMTIPASLTPQLIQALASNWLSDKQISATLGGRASWKAEGWRKAFGVLRDLKKAGVLANGVVPGGQDDTPKAETSFFNTHDVGAIFDASPGISVGYKTAPDYDDYYSLPVPAVPDGTRTPRSPGVPGKGAVINPRGEHPRAALAFVKWLTEPAQQKVFAEQGRILPTNPELLAGARVPRQLAGFSKSLKNMQILPETFTPDVTAAITRDSQSLVLGELTVDQVLDDVQKAQERG
ncbi:extracellular solute-binding protein [Streptomyces fractus]|uniref:ABC transporter substrate-binding protein n=1 Tax=Streptomyces fractus TaxID=641806 RepID=UPI003CE92151